MAQDDKTLENIRNAIVDLLECSEIQHVQKVYDSDTSKIEGDPAVIVSPMNLEASRSSTAKQREVYDFSVKLLYKVDENEQRDSEMKLQTAFGQAYSVLRKVKDLGSAADLFEPISAEFGYQDRGDGTWRVVDMRMIATKRKLRHE